MRRKLVVGNWKMYGRLASNQALLQAILAGDLQECYPRLDALARGCADHTDDAAEGCPDGHLSRIRSKFLLHSQRSLRIDHIFSSLIEL